MDKGADLVLCQHSHCIGCEEKYKDSTILYGQGNFLFDDDDNDYGKTGLLVKLDARMSVSYIPVVKYQSVVRLADGDTASKILREFMDRSKEAFSEECLLNRYNKLSLDYLPYYLQVAGGDDSPLYNKLNSLSHDRLRQYKIKHKYGIEDMVALRNIIECEVHNELFIRGLCHKSDILNSSGN